MLNDRHNLSIYSLNSMEFIYLPLKKIKTYD